MKLLFIINPVAGKGKTRDAIPIIEKFCTARNIEYAIHETNAAGEATQVVRDTCTGYSAVIAAGGDGTVLEVTNGLSGTDIPLGILPLGSGNDFARALNMPIGFSNVERALNIIADKPAFPVDLAKFNGRVFLNIASIGFDAEIVRDLHKIKRFIKGKSAYLVSVFVKFLTYKPKKVEYVIDGSKVVENTFLAAICNGVCYGGGMKVNPNGSITDGFLDVIHIEPVPRYKIPFLLVKFIKGEHLSLPVVKTYRCKEIQIHSNDLVVNVDGECAMTTPVTIRLAPLSLNVIGNI
ncbi:MAG TPA: diacylglycerol kinase family lipid kinase [Clostridiales bacterium]|nr:diacylglycerol kinase family lipid kinase [Clostridiales bacterium]